MGEKCFRNQVMLSKKQGFIFSFITLLCLIIAVVVSKLNLNVNDITEREKCPACYGISLCKDIDDKKVTFEYTNFYSIFNNLLGMKNVYTGKYKNEKVILKKLAYNSELKHFDELVCSSDELNELCVQRFEKSKLEFNYYKLIISELTRNTFDDPNVKLRLCPSVENIDLILNSVKVKSKNFYKYLWSLIKINPEPLILQFLTAEHDWPVPKYFGECGRLIIEEYAGEPLSNFYNESWLKRAKIASSLLDAAYMFTFKNLQFAFYLTDISIDNIVVNKQGKAIFVDLENIIVVDKYPSIDVRSKIKTWNQTHISEIHNDCQDCFTFSPIDICNHKISDHNYYAICQHILAPGFNSKTITQGFLHNPPKEILKEYPTFIYLISQCSKPNLPHSRINFGIELKKILDLVVKYKK